MATAYLGLGSNLGNKRGYLITAMSLLAERAGDIPVVSGFHETVPWGFTSPNTFLNVAVRLNTALSPTDLLAVMQQIERELGRTHKTDGATWQDRTIDIDILMYDNMLMDTKELTLPHPFMHRRLFVMQPLVEIAPRLCHPVLKCSMTELLGILISRKS
ncbi:MAG: 2-amino-4-hydroxy-6-hydroxymethyldihydropteridine diphosphokinase [Tannerella sp.]|jgi:2-amino-4-hydroxy-6-hydroxymethyldihydropteridine diphosphokinase|nr:2-amino-4-hydroxy-6-hydroxymethyldihydropteridine diphosphokinase [Tannerella sp.]